MFYNAHMVNQRAKSEEQAVGEEGGGGDSKVSLRESTGKVNSLKVRFKRGKCTTVHFKREFIAY